MESRIRIRNPENPDPESGTRIRIPERALPGLTVAAAPTVVARK